MALDPELTRRIAESLARNAGNKAAVSRELGVGRQTVIDHCKSLDPTPDAGSTIGEKFVESGDTAEVEFSCEKRIRTVDDAIRHGQIDTSIWRVDRFEVTSWEQGAKLRVVGPDGKQMGDRPTIQTLWRVALKLKRILPKPYLDAAEALFDRVKDHAPRYPKVEYAKPRTPHLLEIDLFDCHFGKLAWARETGEDYDLRIAERLFRDAVHDILSRAEGYGIERIVFPIGNDFCHVDGPNNQTTAGTPQDTDGRFWKIVDIMNAAMVWAFEECLKVAPTKGVLVEGNHDRVASGYLARHLAAWFHRSPDVSIDFEPRSRKYELYGPTLIGWTHGCDEKPSSLPMIMATEAPEMWASSSFREWHCGHFHSSKRTDFNAVSNHDGVKVRNLQSLSGRDAWHYRKGYVGGKRAAEAFLFCRETGDVHSFEVSMRRPG